MTLRFRELESTALYAGLGVRLIDDYARAAAFGWTKIDLDIDDGGTWRPIEWPRAETADGVTWFPWLEHYRDARGLPPRRYRARVATEFYAPLYAFDSEGVEALVVPYDDVIVPATPARPLDVVLLPAAVYAFGAEVPVLHGVVVDNAGDPVRNALVEWRLPALVTNRVLSDEDGEFDLPMRRAPHNTPIVVRATSSEPPPLGRSGQLNLQVPQALATFQTIQIV